MTIAKYRNKSVNNHKYVILVKKLISFIIIIFLSLYYSYAFVYSGEELQYEISYLGVKLCKIVVTTHGKDKFGNVIVQKVRAKIDTYSIPYVSFTGTFESLLDPALTHSHQLTINSKLMKQPWETQKVVFDYAKGVAIHGKWHGSSQIYDDKFAIKGKWNDPISLIFLTRQYSSIKRRISVPTIMDVRKFNVTIDLTGKKESVSISAINYPIKSVYLTAKADWKGVYGLSGMAEAWFSDDAARVPLKAKVDMKIGSVTIELVKWKRQGWLPPKAN